MASRGDFFLNSWRGLPSHSLRWCAFRTAHPPLVPLPSACHHFRASLELPLLTSSVPRWQPPPGCTMGRARLWALELRSSLCVPLGGLLHDVASTCTPALFPLPCLPPCSPGPEDPSFLYTWNRSRINLAQRALCKGWTYCYLHLRPAYSFLPARRGHVPPFLHLGHPVHTYSLPSP